MELFKPVKLPLDKIAAGNRKFFIIGIVILFLIPLFFNPHEAENTICSFKNQTGYDCPTCGMTRSLYEFVHFRIFTSFSYHLMGPLFYSVLIILLIKYLIELKKKILYRFDRRFIIGLTGLFFFTWLLYWIWKFIR